MYVNLNIILNKESYFKIDDCDDKNINIKKYNIKDIIYIEDYSEDDYIYNIIIDYNSIYNLLSDILDYDDELILNFYKNNISEYKI